MTTKLTKCCIIVFILSTLISAQAADLYYSASGSGYYPWDNVSGWIRYAVSGGGAYGQLPTTNDNVFISATTPKAENGNAITVTNGVFAECDTFASGYGNYIDTAWFRLDGGSLTCRTDFVTGRSYPGLTTLESGNLYNGANFIIGYYSGSSGTVSNNSSSVYSKGPFVAGYNSGSSGTLVLNGGSITGADYAAIGRAGDGLAELNTGTVHIAGNLYMGFHDGSSGVVTNNGAVLSSGGEIRMGYNSGAFGKLVQNGGSITGSTDIIVGNIGNAVVELNTGALHCTKRLYVGKSDGGNGVVTNNGADISADFIYAGCTSGAYGRLIHNNGTLDLDHSLHIGTYGGTGEFEVNAPFSANLMVLGTGLADEIPGTGTVTVAENAVGTIDTYLRVNNGNLYMRGGEIHLQNVGGSTKTNLYVRTGTGINRYGKIQGWGAFTNVNSGITLIMVNDGQIIADGEGVERDLNLNQFAVVDNWSPNGASDTNGWYAINKGRVLFPRSWITFPAGSAKCWGDLYSKSVPEMVNSVALNFGDTSGSLYVRGGFCASDRSDIPSGLPEGNLRPIGIWFIGATNDKLLMTRKSFDSVSLNFRYDHTKVMPNDSSLRLYRYNGSNWDKVGDCEPDNSTSLISTDTSLTPVSSGDYNIGWFAVMAVEMSGTVIMVQ